MNVFLNEAHYTLRKKVREFAEKHIKPVIGEFEAKEKFPTALIKSLMEQTLFGMHAPEKYGGQNSDYLSFILAVEELARIDSSVAATLAAHNSLGVGPILEFGTDEQRSKYLPELCSGGKLWAFGLTEENAGSDVKGVETIAEELNDGWLINGHKKYITNVASELSSGITLVAQTAVGNNKKKEFTAFLAPKTTPGYTCQFMKNKLLWRAADNGMVYFKDCLIPSENQLGKRGEGIKIMLKTIDSGRLSIAAMGLGLAQGAFEMAVDFAKKRKQFGKPISDFQVISFKIADMAMQIENARNSLYHACWLKDNGHSFGTQAAMAKLYCSQVASSVASEALQIFGGAGFFRNDEYPIERFFRDQRLLSIGEGTSEILRMVIARSVLNDGNEKNRELMHDEKKIARGFSKLNRKEKINWLIQELNLEKSTAAFLDSFELDNPELQSIIAELSENQISNYHLPFTIAPSFLIDGKMLTLPLVTEESSVVAALAKAAGYWAKRGGFRTKIIGTEKKGQVHFTWNGNPEKLKKIFPEIKIQLLKETASLTRNMEKRGGGIREILLKHLPDIQSEYYQIDVSFETSSAMGANFINSCLEQMGKTLKNYIEFSDLFSGNEKEVKIIMAILSNYVPGSRVKVWVECPVEDLAENQEQAKNFAEKFLLAVHIARNDVSRAVTHNKGIFNGIDALAVATGNDYRAIEAGAHAYASKDGMYRGLSEVRNENKYFRFEMEIPLAVGVVGGVTGLHPLAKLAMKILQNPSAPELMSYIATAGLASNWSAINALVTSGIQKGHMKMHLSNILRQFSLSEEQKAAAKTWFSDKEVSYSAVQNYLEKHV